MRRRDREQNDPLFLDQVLRESETIFLALHDGEYPYCLPVNFAKVNEKIYIHSALEGHKLDCIRKNTHAAFSCATDIQIDREESTTYYKSVCGTALANIVEDEKEKALALDALTDRYNSRCEKPAPPASVRRVAIIRLDIQSATGKCCLQKKKH